MVHTVTGPGRRPTERVWAQAVSPHSMRQQLPGVGQAVQQVSEVIVQVPWRELGTEPASLREANPCLELPEIPVCTHEPGKDEVEFQILNAQENYTGHRPQWVGPGKAGPGEEYAGPSHGSARRGQATQRAQWIPKQRTGEGDFGSESRGPGDKPPKAKEGWCCLIGCQGPVPVSPALENQGNDFGWDQ